MELRILSPDDAALYRDIHLQALTDAPESFGGDYRRARKRPLSHVARGLRADSGNFVLGAFDESGKLAGVTGFGRERHLEHAEEGVLWGMFVRKEYRRRGVASALVARLVAAAGALEGLRRIRLTVLADNDAAKSLYETSGFETAGIDHGTFEFRGKSYDEVRMEMSIA